MEAKTLYQNGQLTAAIAAAVTDTKRYPADIARRDVLRELLCIAGDYERADKQLEIMALQDKQASLGIALQRQLLRAAQARYQVFKQGRLPELIGEATPNISLHLQALAELRMQQYAKAAELLAIAEQQRSQLTGRHNGLTFVGIRDLDDLNAGFVELLTSNGKYYWLDFSQIRSIELREPTSLLELHWRRALIEVSGGPEGEVYLPTTYFDFSENLDESVLLGQQTLWQETAKGLVQGQGQKMWLLGDEAINMMALGNLELQV